jgi:hypothetical protein
MWDNAAVAYLETVWSIGIPNTYFGKTHAPLGAFTRVSRNETDRAQLAIPAGATYLRVTR